MTNDSAFWDSSALTPLCLYQPTTAHVKALARRYSVVTWWGSLIEIHSAMERVHRSGELDDHERLIAIASIVRLSDRWREIPPDRRLRDQALYLLSKHPLRADDSLQLAAAMVRCGFKPVRRTFLCADTKLCDAASAEGFTVIKP
jgi:predicted nucleic acid-binding protein